MKTLRGFFGGLLLGVAVAAAGPALGQEQAVEIMGAVHEVDRQAGMLHVREGNRGRGPQQAIQLGPDVLVLRLRRDRAHRITIELAAADQIRRGDFVVITATRDGGVLRAVEVRIAPDDGR